MREIDATACRVPPGAIGLPMSVAERLAQGEDGGLPLAADGRDRAPRGGRPGAHGPGAARQRGEGRRGREVRPAGVQREGPRGAAHPGGRLAPLGLSRRGGESAGAPGPAGDVAAFSLTDAKGKGGRHAWSSTPSRTGRGASPSTIRTDGSARPWTWSPMVPPREPSSTSAGRAGRSWDTPSWKGGRRARGSGARSLGMEVREFTRRTAGLSPRALGVGPDRSVILPSSRTRATL